MQILRLYELNILHGLSFPFGTSQVIIHNDYEPVCVAAMLINTNMIKTNGVYTWPGSHEARGRSSAGVHFYEIWELYGYLWFVNSTIVFHFDSSTLKLSSPD